MYYQAATANTFPAAFVDKTVSITANNSSNQPGIQLDALSDVYVMEYSVRPTYGLNQSTVTTNIVAQAMNIYNKLSLDANSNPADGSHHTETIPQLPGSILYKGAAALVGTYATKLKIDMIFWRFNPNAITNGTDVSTNAVPWEQQNSPSVIIPTTGVPGAKAKFKYNHSSGRIYQSISAAAFDI
jgi:hypothetical protein